MELQERSASYYKCDKIYKMYKIRDRWEHKAVWSKARRNRISSVIYWYTLRLKKAFFKDNPRAVWIQSWEDTAYCVVVTFLEEK